MICRPKMGEPDVRKCRVAHGRLERGSSPSGVIVPVLILLFEKYFEELIRLLPNGKPQPEAIGPIARRYGLEIDPSTIAALCAEHGLTFG